jgi:hypothetical protein
VGEQELGLEQVVLLLQPLNSAWRKIGII